MRKALIILMIVGAILIATLMLGLCAGPPGYYADKYAGADALATPTSLPGDYTAESQTEGHTCGMHAIRSIYAAYGIEPDSADLRFRLGTDKPLTNITPDLTGTLHPDLLRVLRQDGFDAQLVMMKGDGRDRIETHLGAATPSSPWSTSAAPSTGSSSPGSKAPTSSSSTRSAARPTSKTSTPT